MTPDTENGGNVVDLAITRCDGSVVRVTGKAVTRGEVLELIEDGLRGAGFDVPHESLVVEHHPPYDGGGAAFTATTKIA